MGEVHNVIVDVETNGTDPARHVAVEVAWWNLTTRERGCFIPRHDWRDVVANAELEALRISRYVDRLAGQSPDNGDELIRLWEQFGGPIDAAEDTKRPLPADRVLCGVNVAGFDAPFISNLFRDYTERRNPELELSARPWSYRMRNLSDYAAGVLGLNLGWHPVSSAKIAQALGVPIGDHTAEGDVTSCGRAFLELAELAEHGSADAIAVVRGELARLLPVMAPGSAA